jgi:hypothetical protein
MLDNVTNRNFVPAPRSMLDPVDAMGRTKIKWFRLVHIANNNNDATKSEKASTLILD